MMPRTFQRHSKGRVTMRLASDASKVKLLVGESIGTIVSVSTMLVAGLSIGMFYCWQEALLMTAAIPVVVFFAAIQVRVVTGFSDSSEFEVGDNQNTIISSGLHHCLSLFLSLSCNVRCMVETSETSRHDSIFTLTTMLRK